MIVFKDINKVFYIQEIKDFKEMALKSITRHERYYLKTRKKLLKKLKKEQILNIGNDYELEMIRLDYLYKLSCNQLNYYKILSSYYQCLFSIWENASKKYNQKIKYKDFNSEIVRLYYIVNVLKHGKGVSFEKLKTNFNYCLNHSYNDIL